MGEYKIGEIEILTGIKSHTIRIWEKRYNLIAPKRKDSNIRMYTEEDLLLLLNIAILNKSGYKISQICKLSPGEINKLVLSKSNEHYSGSIIEYLVVYSLDLNEPFFLKLLSDYKIDNGFELTFTKLIVPLLVKMGTLWQTGAITACQEHFISNLIRQFLISEINSLKIPSGSRKSVILFLPEHEWHELSLLFYSYKLKSMGINTFYLGQSVPYHSLLDILHRLKPKFLITSWLTSVDSRNISNYFKKLKRDYPMVTVFAGGGQINRFEHLLDPYLKVISEENYESLFETILQ